LWADNIYPKQDVHIQRYASIASRRSCDEPVATSDADSGAKELSERGGKWSSSSIAGTDKGCEVDSNEGRSEGKYSDEDD